MRGRALGIAWGAALLVAAGCPAPTVSIVAPRANALLDDPSVAIEVRVPRRFVLDAAALRVDGVDLAAALGLVPPFADASGNVVIGGEVVAVAGFDYEIPASGDVWIRATLAGLASADHVVEAEALPSGGGAATTKSRSFAVVAPMTLEAETIASSGTPPPPPIPGNRMGNATLGEPLAAPPVALASGAGELRPGYVPAAQARAGGF